MVVLRKVIEPERDIAALFECLRLGSWVGCLVDIVRSGFLVERIPFNSKRSFPA